MNSNYQSVRHALNEENDPEQIFKQLNLLMNYFDVWEKSLKERENKLQDSKYNVIQKEQIQKLEQELKQKQKIIISYEQNQSKVKKLDCQTEESLQQLKDIHVKVEQKQKEFKDCIENFQYLNGQINQFEKILSQKQCHLKDITERIEIEQQKEDRIMSNIKSLEKLFATFQVDEKKFQHKINELEEECKQMITKKSVIQGDLLLMEKKVEYGRIELAKIQEQLSKNMKEFIKEKKSIELSNQDFQLIKQRDQPYYMSMIAKRSQELDLREKELEEKTNLLYNHLKSINQDLTHEISLNESQISDNKENSVLIQNTFLKDSNEKSAKKQSKIKEQYSDKKLKDITDLINKYQIQNDQYEYRQHNQSGNKSLYRLNSYMLDEYE